MAFPLYTVGHSNYSVETFLKLLKTNAIEAVADVRSSPYSQYCPQFNREALAAALKQNGILYAFLGNELGARTDDTTCYENGRVVYERLAATEPFQSGLRRVQKAAATRRVALMCAEKEPLECHRSILVCRHLPDMAIHHILETGETETHQDTECRLMELLGIVSPNLFFSDEELVAQAYAAQEGKIAYRLPVSDNRGEGERAEWE